jgi:hypothetical protein
MPAPAQKPSHIHFVGAEKIDFARSLASRARLRVVGGGRFSAREMRAIDVAHRTKDIARCPLDEKPLLTTTWGDTPKRMVYFVCRACSRIGAIAYESTDPSVPGIIAIETRPSKPPSSR